MARGSFGRAGRIALAIRAFVKNPNHRRAMPCYSAHGSGESTSWNGAVSGHRRQGNKRRRVMIDQDVGRISRGWNGTDASRGIHRTDSSDDDRIEPSSGDEELQPAGAVALARALRAQTVVVPDGKASEAASAADASDKAITSSRELVCVPPTKRARSGPAEAAVRLPDGAETLASFLSRSKAFNSAETEKSKQEAKQEASAHGGGTLRMAWERAGSGESERAAVGFRGKVSASNATSDQGLVPIEQPTSGPDQEQHLPLRPVKLTLGRIVLRIGKRPGSRWRGRTDNASAVSDSTGFGLRSAYYGHDSDDDDGVIGIGYPAHLRAQGYPRR